MWVIFALLDPDPDPDPDSEYGSGFTDPIEYGSNPDPVPDPNPQPCSKYDISSDFVILFCLLRTFLAFRLGLRFFI